MGNCPGDAASVSVKAGYLPRVEDRATCWGSRPERLPWGREQCSLHRWLLPPVENSPSFPCIAFVPQCVNSPPRFLLAFHVAFFPSQLALLIPGHSARLATLSFWIEPVRLAFRLCTVQSRFPVGSDIDQLYPQTSL